MEKVAKASSDLRSSIRELERGERAGQMLLNNREINKELEDQEFWYKRGSNKAKLRQRGRKYDSLFHDEQQVKKANNIHRNRINDDESRDIDLDDCNSIDGSENNIGYLSDPD